MLRPMLDFHGLSLIIACLARTRIAVRETETRIRPWTQTEKDNALAKCRPGLRAWHTKKPTLCLYAVTDEDGHPLESEDASGMRLRAYWGKIFEARAEGDQHHCHETILQNVQTAPDDPLQMCRRIGLSVLIQRVLTSAGRWCYPCTVRCE